MNAGQSSSSGAALGGHSREEWNTAYLAVESYFEALLVSDRLLRAGLITRVLDAARNRAERDRESSATALAMKELDRAVTDWFGAVLDEPLQPGNVLLSTRGRLALLLAEMPARWQEQFLQPGPWPAEFVRAMRESFLRAGPDFQFSQMEPRPIDLGPMATLTELGNLPYFRMLMIWFGFALLLALVFYMTH
jgi:hypothetical protein